MIKISKIELTQERLIIAIASAIAVIILLIYFTFYAPLIKKLKVSYRECKSCETEVFRVRNIIESVSKTGNGKTLITEDDVSLAIDELTRHGKSIGVNFISIKPKEIMDEKGSKYKLLPIEMEIESKDEQFSEFLGSLDELKKSLIKIKSFDLIPNKEDRTRINARVTVDMHLSSGLHNEE